MSKRLYTVCKVALLLLTLSIGAFAQETFPANGVKDSRLQVYAFTNATIYVDYQTVLQNATLIIKEGKVEQVGAGIAIPKEAIVTDLKGKTIYPSFVDPYSQYGIPAVKAERASWGGQPQLDTKTSGPFNWNEAVKAEYNAYTEFTVNPKEAENLRKAGFGAVNTFRADGLVRGSSALVSLASDRDQNVVLNERTAAHFSLDKGSSRQSYPSSMMGYIALIRQTYLDAQWYKNGGNKTFNDQSLESFNRNQSLPSIFDASDKLNLLRAAKIGSEFGVNYIIKGGGDEYQRINDVKATKASLIIPVNFPDAYDVEDPYDAMMVSLADLKHWELAPTNPSVLASNGVAFAFTASGLKDPSQYLSNIRKAVKAGLDEKTALKAMTATPAQFLRSDNTVGALRKGMLANFVVTNGNLFEDDTKIYQNWVQGKPYVLAEINEIDLSGKYNLMVGNTSYLLEISGKPGSPSAKVKVNDTTELKSTFKMSQDLLSLSFDADKEGNGKIRLSGWMVGKDLKGNGQLVNGEWINWTATYAEALKAEEKKEEKKEEEKKEELGKVIYPFTAFGNETLPKSELILIKNATIWTNEAQGIVTETDVLLKDGKISQIGKNLSSAGARVIDGTGKHLTAGIIDEHTHIAATSINDVQSVSAEVRMGDVIDSEDIDIYRQLAGGVVAGQILHGSANAIGGQSALVKYRWGLAPEQLKINGADGFIKCALGENVKQSNWGDGNTIRYPQTRMGVEQVFVDAFTRAQEYEKEWNAYNALPAKTKAATAAPRRDLELETLLEILRKKRFISCHSYVQSEINMLMKVAERFDFRINTFTHILEGYKLADKMAEHGVAASTFADWWAYKMEVREAIPYNAALMNGEGVVTAINSDDAEMARRLNQEAAKTVKYGGVSEEEAWKMVTLNPAKMLHLDNRMGSIKVGKDADVVLWSDNPLSIYAKAEKTIIDGAVYFDIEQEQAKRTALEQEKARLIQKMLDVKKAGGPTQRPAMRQKHMFHCEDVIYHSHAENLD
ncbi:amidohydrolase family protein [Cytophagales bacterium LB-30]|uniref:Amidohydrolase family protein n=1 Tax=Shiella aurantiaca TaxID=3058365 RepID=A0ABT8F164_9BACT|nr:amidohydrolase family protein [Shiella aurantiaca]MDN4164190.1 amidohydrolase family protein [Shiella aurantiaca]